MRPSKDQDPLSPAHLTPTDKQEAVKKVKHVYNIYFFNTCMSIIGKVISGHEHSTGFISIASGFGYRTGVNYEICNLLFLFLPYPMHMMCRTSGDIENDRALDVLNYWL